MYNPNCVPKKAESQKVNQPASYLSYPLKKFQNFAAIEYHRRREEEAVEEERKKLSIAMLNANYLYLLVVGK